MTWAQIRDALDNRNRIEVTVDLDFSTARLRSSGYLAGEHRIRFDRNAVASEHVTMFPNLGWQRIIGGFDHAADLYRNPYEFRDPSRVVTTSLSIDDIRQARDEARANERLMGPPGHSLPVSFLDFVFEITGGKAPVFERGPRTEQQERDEIAQRLAGPNWNTYAVAKGWGVEAVHFVPNWAEYADGTKRWPTRCHHRRWRCKLTGRERCWPPESKIEEYRRP